MSRPFRLFQFAACVALLPALTACVGTLYRPMYSYRNTHFKPPPEKKEASAADVLKALEGGKKEAPPEGLTPGPEVPGLPGGMPGEAPPAGGAPAIPGLPPAAPPPVPPPAVNLASAPVRNSDSLAGFHRAWYPRFQSHALYRRRVSLLTFARHERIALRDA